MENDFGSSGDRFYAFAFGSFETWAGSGWDYLWANDINEAFIKLRQVFPDKQLTIRSAVYGEWECDSFSISGHIPHTE